MSEAIIKNTSVHGKSCIGCENHERDIMVAYMDESGPDVHDLFFTDKQAKVLIEQLQAGLNRNA